MKREIQVGDRVAVYRATGQWSDQFPERADIVRERAIGQVLAVRNNSVLVTIAGKSVLVTRQQCRRLKRGERSRWEGEWCNAGEVPSCWRVFMPKGERTDLPDPRTRMTLVEARPGKARK